MSLDKCVRIYDVEKGRVRGRVSLLEGTAPAKAGEEGAQGSRKLEQSYNGSSPPPPAQDLAPVPFALTTVRAWDGAVWSQHLAPPPGGTLPVFLASPSPRPPTHHPFAAAPGGSSPVTHYLQSGRTATHCPHVPGHRKGLGSEMTRIPSLGQNEWSQIFPGFPAQPGAESCSVAQ